uniref:Uncharacterized protein n=1 Tax=Anguilla anguilla TaxID=7936 RepID=A0A0E9W8S0_ANGAN
MNLPVMKVFLNLLLYKYFLRYNAVKTNSRIVPRAGNTF